MPTHQRALAAAALAASLLSAPACDIKVNQEGGVSLGITEGRATDVWTRSYALEAGTRLEVEAGNGDIQVTPATGPQVEINADREVRGRDDAEASERLKQLKMDEVLAPGLVRVADPPSERGARRDRVRISYRVKLPAGAAASFITQNGDVHLENVQGTLRASTTNGRVAAKGVTGALEAGSVNGGIDVAMASVTGDVIARTVNGGIDIDLPADVNADLAASTVNGGIRLDDGLTLAGGQRDPLRVRGRLNKGGPRIRVETTNGGIRLGVQGGGQPVTIQETPSP